MDTLQIVTLFVLAVLMFWAVGAHNRIVAMRNAIGGAYAQIDAQLRRRHELLPQLISALRPLLASEHGTLDAVQNASEQAHVAGQVVRPRPGSAPDVARLAQAEQALAATLARLRALLDLQRAHAEDPAVAAAVAELAAIEQKLVFARQLFNTAVLEYNEAVHQFPTRMLTPLFRFGPAGQL
jgi:LemA protein